MSLYARLTVIGLLSVAVPPCAHAQQNVFQSASSDSSIFLSAGAGVASYNLGDSTARFDLLHDSGGSIAFGGGAGGTIKASAANVLNKNAPAPGGFVEGGVVLRPPRNNKDAEGKPCWYVENNAPDLSKTGPTATTRGKCSDKRYLQYGIVQFRYGRTQFYTLPAASLPLASPTQVNFNQFRGTLAYNSLLKTQSVDYRFGLAYVPGSANNLTNLTEETYQSQVISSTSTGQSTLTPASNTVYVGSYQTHVAEGVNADFVIQPGGVLHYELGLDILLRSDLGGGAGTRYANPGLGLYFFKAKAPVIPVAGIAYTYQSGTSQIALEVAWTFGGTSPAK